MNFFPRPDRSRVRPPPAPRAPAIANPDPDAPIAPHWKGTLFALVIIAFTAITLNGWRPSDIARYAAICTAIALCVSIGFDLRRGLRNLQRTDLFAILAYYFLTLFEFLFPQANFNKLVTRESASDGVIICLIGFAGLLVGRHLLIPKRQPFRATLTYEIPRGWLITIFWVSFFVGFSNMLFAVHFNFFELISWFMAPRFTQPWTRGRLGDWSSLFYELQMFIQLLPPLAGIILARRHRYSLASLVLIGAGFALTLFYGFSSGTRNVFATHLVTFLMGYSLAIPPARTRHLVMVAACGALFLCFASYFMLQFREVGLKNYFKGGRVPSAMASGDKATLFVDYNLFSICKLVEFFPSTHPYLGVEIPYQALIRPIPRALWPDKPTGLSLSMEDALNLEGLTISASFAGEAYMSGGWPMVVAVALLLGAFTGWWGALSSPRNSEIGHLVYASGFLVAVISMRSLFVFTTALLPSLAAVGISALVVRVLSAQARKFLGRAKPLQRRPVPPQPLRRA